MHTAHTITATTADTTTRRRNFLASAALGLATAPIASLLATPARAATGEGATGFASLKTVAAGDLRVAYAEAGPADGPVAILLHGWPYDIHAFVAVAPRVAGAGYRVIVPSLGG